MSHPLITMILYFSATGNSRWVAEGLARRLGQRAVSLTGPLGHIADSQIIWVFPVHSWGLPPYVVAKIRTLDIDTPAHHMVATCGDDAGLTDRQWRREVSARGWRPVSAHTVQMPNTYVALPGFDTDPQELQQSKLHAAEERLDHIAAVIRTGREVTDTVRGSLPALKSRVVYPVFMRCMVNPGWFRVNTDACVSCGACRRACPVGNITLRDGHPHWGPDCTGCLACYHHCPTHAITYGPFTGHKGQYVKL